jgi:hypothetical protein
MDESEWNAFAKWNEYIHTLSDEAYDAYVESMTDKTFKKYLMMPKPKENILEDYTAWKNHQIEELYKKHMGEFRAGDSITFLDAGIRRRAKILSIEPEEFRANGKQFMILRIKFKTSADTYVYSLKSTEIGKSGYDFEHREATPLKSVKSAKRRRHSVGGSKM